MDFNDFLRITAAFATSPTDIDYHAGQFTLQLSDDVICGELRQRDGDLQVREMDQEEWTRATSWIVSRVARCDTLAERIIHNIHPDEGYVPPAGQFLDTLERSPDEDVEDVDPVDECLADVLGRRRAGTTSVIYLTADAGEGKTTVISQLAIRQALAYRQKTTDWLLLPVGLAGRSLLRFDDAITGELMNRLRFQYWYYDAVIQLMRLGVVVLALDGFEEMFIEGSTGEAVSNLSNLVRLLDRHGTVLIASRKAYFEYASLDTQARLFDSIGSGDVTFAKVSIKRWDRARFLQYCRKVKRAGADALYSSLVGVLKPEHPLLTRPVFVKKLLGVVATAEGMGALLQRLDGESHEYFGQFVATIIERESAEKWVNRTAEPYVPLLSVQEHYQLLALLAGEMWTQHTGVLRGDLVSLLMDLFCEDRDKSVQVSRQVKERMRTHPLLACMETGGVRQEYRFDHIQFQHFFLGWGVANAILERNQGEAQSLFQADAFSDETANMVRHFLMSAGVQAAAESLSFICSIARGAGRDSYMSENVASLVVRLIPDSPSERLAFTGLAFPTDALSLRPVRDVSFSDCRFQPTGVCKLDGCTFNGCQFERLELDAETPITHTSMSDSEVLSVQIDQAVIYDPARIRQVVLQRGVQLLGESEAPQLELCPYDYELQLAERVFKAFLRSTYLGEPELKRRLHDDVRCDDLVQALLRGGVIEEVTSLPASRRPYRLAVPMRVIKDALAVCDGSFSSFLEHVHASVDSDEA